MLTLYRPCANPTLCRRYAGSMLTLCGPRTDTPVRPQCWPYGNPLLALCCHHDVRHHVVPTGAVTVRCRRRVLHTPAQQSGLLPPNFNIAISKAFSQFVLQIVVQLVFLCRCASCTGLVSLAWCPLLGVPWFVSLALKSWTSRSTHAGPWSWFWPCMDASAFSGLCPVHICTFLFVWLLGLCPVQRAVFSARGRDGLFRPHQDKHRLLPKTWVRVPYQASSSAHPLTQLLCVPCVTHSLIPICCNTPDCHTCHATPVFEGNTMQYDTYVYE